MAKPPHIIEIMYHIHRLKRKLGAIEWENEPSPRTCVVVLFAGIKSPTRKRYLSLNRCSGPGIYSSKHRKIAHSS